MYRFLVPYEQILADERIRSMYENESPGFTAFYKTEVGRPGFLLNAYPCRRGELLYCALLHLTKPSEEDIDNWDHPASVTDVLECAAPFHPALQAICEKATDVKVYNQMFRNAIPRFTKGKAVLIGDAAHFMLPTHGQGASISIEDAAALEVLFDTGASSSSIPSSGTDLVTQRLPLFQQLRHPRATAVQAMSNYMMAGGPKMIAEASKYYNGPLPPPGAKTFSEPFCDFFFKYDVFEEVQKGI